MSAIPLFIVSFTLITSGPLSAAVVVFNVALNSSLSGTGSPGTGTAVATFDDSTGILSITGNYTGLNGSVTASHLHGYTASPGTGNAGVAFGLSNSGGTAGTISGSGTIPGVSIPQVLAGHTYINLHSAVHPGGEIRGYLINPVPEPSLALLGGLGFLGLLRRRR